MGGPLHGEKPLTFAELFAGCGGISLGLKAAGFDLVFAQVACVEVLPGRVAGSDPIKINNLQEAKPATHKVFTQAISTTDHRYTGLLHSVNIYG